MIKVGRKKLEAQAQPIPIVQAGEAQFLVSDKRRNARREAPFLRVLGNLLILTGVLMLLGIGGWYGYTQWNAEQTRQDVESRFVIPTAGPTEPAIAIATAVPTATALATAIESLNPNGKDGTHILTASEKKIDTSPPVRLAISSVNIDSKVVPVGWDMIPRPGGGAQAEWQVADYAVGHHQGSANPGQPGNVVLSGHVDYKGEVFRNLHLVNKGDQVVVYTERGQYLYVVDHAVIVQEDGASEEQKRANARYMDPTADPTLTMITCFPYGIDDKRLIVIAKPYQPTTTTQSEFSLR
jgi:LPXTG-site transpeptidase (sortase) family protein